MYYQVLPRRLPFRDPPCLSVSVSGTSPCIQVCGDDFKRLSNEVASLHVVLKETEDYVHEFTDFDTSRNYRLKILTDGCNDILKDLEKLLNSYESLGTQAQRTWDRMRFGLEDLTDMRSRLVSQATLLTAFNSTLIKYVQSLFFYYLTTQYHISSSTTRIEKRLNKFIAEVRAGYREGSVVTTADVTESIESPDVWHQLRRELEDVGISPSVMEENHQYISGWMKAALSQGLDEVCSDDLSTPSLSSLKSGGVDSPSMTAVAVNDSVFEAELRRKQAIKPVEQVILPTVKKRSDPVSMIQKLFQKNTAIIQAASDGDLNKVVKFISIGCDVNTRDRWG